MRALVRDVCLVALGGAVGSVARWGAGHVLPAGSAWHWPTLAVNVLGALLLGLLLESLTRPGTGTPRAHTVRLLVGTGALGGFTTYSTFALEVWDGVNSGATGPALGYAGLTVASGLLAAALGMLLGSRWGHRGAPTAASGEAGVHTAGAPRKGAGAASSCASTTPHGPLPADVPSAGPQQGEHS